MWHQFVLHMHFDFVENETLNLKLLKTFFLVLPAVQQQQKKT